MSLAVVLALRRSRRSCPGRSSPCIVGVVAVDAVRPRTTRVSPSSAHIDSGLPSVGLPDGVGFDDYLARRRRRPRRSCSSASPRGSARPRPTPPRDHYEIDANRELLGLGAANLGVGLSQRAWSSTAACRRRRSTASAGRHGRRCPASSSPPSRSSRCCSSPGCSRTCPRPRSPPWSSPPCRAGRHRRPARLLPTCTPGASGGSTARPPGPTSSPPLPRCSACSSSTRCPGWSSASSCRCCCCSTGPRGRTSPSSATSPGRADQFADRDRHPENDAVPGVVVLRVEAGLFFANAEAVREAIDQGATPRDGHPGPSCSTPSRSRSSTSPPSGCSTSSPTTSPATASARRSPTISARSATSSPPGPHRDPGHARPSRRRRRDTVRPEAPGELCAPRS